MRKLLTAGALFLMFSNAYADSLYKCMLSAASYYHVPYALLYAIAKVESDFSPYCININHKGRSVGQKCYSNYADAYYEASKLYLEGYNIDIGLMQINSQNIRDYGWDIENVLYPCSNVYYGAFLLSRNFHIYGYNWKAIWHYNGSPSYAYKIERVLRHLR